MRSRTGSVVVRSSASKQLLHRDRGRPVLTGVFVGAGVGDDQGVGGGADGIEQQLPVLRTDVAFTRERTTRQDVVAVGDVGARKDAVVEADQAHHAMRHRAHGDHGAHRQRAGAEVGAGGTAGQLPLQQGPHVGQPQCRAGPRARVRQHFRQFAVELRLLPLLVGTDPRELCDALAQHLDQLSSGCAPASRSTTPHNRCTYSASRPASSTRFESTSSSGSAVPSQSCESSDIAVPTSSRSTPNCQVFCGYRCSAYAVRCAASKPHRIPAAPTHSVRSTRSSSPHAKAAYWLAVRQAQHRTGGAAVGDVEQFGQHPEQGLVWVSARSANRTRRLWAGWPRSACSPAPNAAVMSGA